MAQKYNSEIVKNIIRRVLELEEKFQYQSDFRIEDILVALQKIVIEEVDKDDN